MIGPEHVQVAVVSPGPTGLVGRARCAYEVAAAGVILDVDLPPGEPLVEDPLGSWSTGSDSSAAPAADKGRNPPHGRRHDDEHDQSTEESGPPPHTAVPVHHDESPPSRELGPRPGGAAACGRISRP